MLAAQANIQETWEDLLGEAKLQDRDTPLDVFDGLRNPTNPVVALLLWIYQSETYCYKLLNHASRFKDTSKVKTLGPFGHALFKIIVNA